MRSKGGRDVTGGDDPAVGFAGEKRASPFLEEDLFVGRLEELAKVRAFASDGKSSLVIGGRRCGKTLLARHLGDVGRKVFYVDLGGWDLESEATARRSLGKSLGATCETRDDLQACLEALAPLVLILDETDRLLAETWAGRFLAFLRCLDDTVMRSDIAFVLVGGPALCGYRNPDDGGSPPLNIAEPIYLRPLSYRARRELLARMPRQEPPLRETELFSTTGGHPWLLTRLLDRLWHGRTLEDAKADVFESALMHFASWRNQLGATGEDLLRLLPAEGIPKTALQRSSRWRKFHPTSVRARCLCLIDTSEDGGRILPGPRLFLDWLDTISRDEERYDVAISYASDDEKLAHAIYRELEGFRVFFAPACDLWGDSLPARLSDVFQRQSRYVLVLSSKTYVKHYWTRQELRLALDGTARLLLVDLGQIPAQMPKDVVYRSGKPDQLVTLVNDLKKKLASPDPPARSEPEPEDEGGAHGRANGGSTEAAASAPQRKELRGTTTRRRQKGRR